MSQIRDSYSYYPGCSLETSAQAYGDSIKYVAEILGLRLEEIDDWNCCGATEYISLSAIPAYSLIARNLAIAAQGEAHDLVAPCSACYLNLHRVDEYMEKYSNIQGQVNRALGAGGLHYEPGVLSVRHLLHVITDDVGYDAIAAKVTQPLIGLRVAPYYGCLITRPLNHGDPEQPIELDLLLRTLGATVVAFPLKTACCGGHMTSISEETAYDLMRRILDCAAERQADAIVTACPMCQLNLDAFQPYVNHMFGTKYRLPILYFTQLMGLAFGFPQDQLGFGDELVSAASALAKIGQEEPGQPAHKGRRDKKALPVPEPLIKEQERP